MPQAAEPEDTEALFELPDMYRVVPVRDQLAIEWASGDSVEFTFRSVNPPSGDFEVALYNSDLVIVQKVVGEPPPKEMRLNNPLILVAALLMGIAGLVIVGYSAGFLVERSGEKVSNVSAAGCELRMVSLYGTYGQNFHSPWQIKDRVFNVGNQACVVQSAQLNPKGQFSIPAGDVFEREWIVERPPKLVDGELSVGATNTTLKTAPIRLYVER